MTPVLLRHIVAVGLLLQSFLASANLPTLLQAIFPSVGRPAKPATVTWKEGLELPKETVLLELSSSASWAKNATEVIKSYSRKWRSFENRVVDPPAFFSSTQQQVVFSPDKTFSLTLFPQSTGFLLTSKKPRNNFVKSFDSVKKPKSEKELQKIFFEWAHKLGLSKSAFSCSDLPPDRIFNYMKISTQGYSKLKKKRVDRVTLQGISGYRCYKGKRILSPGLSKNLYLEIDTHGSLSQLSLNWKEIVGERVVKNLARKKDVEKRLREGRFFSPTENARHFTQIRLLELEMVYIDSGPDLYLEQLSPAYHLLAEGLLAEVNGEKAKSQIFSLLVPAIDQ